MYVSLRVPRKAFGLMGRFPSQQRTNPPRGRSVAPLSQLPHPTPPHPTPPHPTPPHPTPPHPTHPQPTPWLPLSPPGWREEPQQERGGAQGRRELELGFGAGEAGVPGETRREKPSRGALLKWGEKTEWLGSFSERSPGEARKTPRKGLRSLFSSSFFSFLWFLLPLFGNLGLGSLFEPFLRLSPEST